MGLVTRNAVGSSEPLCTWPSPSHRCAFCPLYPPPIHLSHELFYRHWINHSTRGTPQNGPTCQSRPLFEDPRIPRTRVFRQLEAKSFTSCWRVIKELRCGRVLDPNVARPLSRAATMINVRGRGTFSSLVAVRRTMSYSCRRAASGSIRDARLAGA